MDSALHPMLRFFNQLDEFFDIENGQKSIAKDGENPWQFAQAVRERPRPSNRSARNHVPAQELTDAFRAWRIFSLRVTAVNGFCRREGLSEFRPCSSRCSPA